MPGYANEQLSPNFSVSEMISLDAGGGISGAMSGNWSYDSPWLTLNYSDGTIAQVRVERGRDWEKEIASTILFTGLTDQKITVWGKKN